MSRFKSTATNPSEEPTASTNEPQAEMVKPSTAFATKPTKKTTKASTEYKRKYFHLFL